MKKSIALAAVLVSVAAFQPGVAEARSRGGAVATGIVVGTAAALVAGAALATPRGCWIERRPVYNRFGEYRGRRAVRVCN